MTPLQSKALQILARVNECSAYTMRARLDTLHSLRRKGFVRAEGHGHMAMPHSAAWRITDAGRAALAQA